MRRLPFWIVASILVVAPWWIIAMWRDRSNRDGTANHFAAREIVQSQAADNNLLVFATRNVQSRQIVVAGCNVCVIVNEEIIGNYQRHSGSYPEHHNIMVKKYAADQFCRGCQELGIALFDLLSQAHPDLEVTIPGGRNVAAIDVCKKIRSDPEEARTLLVYEADQWKALSVQKLRSSETGAERGHQCAGLSR